MVSGPPGFYKFPVIVKVDPVLQIRAVGQHLSPSLAFKLLSLIQAVSFHPDNEGSA